MAIINIEKLEQIKRENEIQRGIHKTAFAMWVDGVNNRVKSLSPSLMDIIDTFSYFVRNRLDLSVFSIEGNHFSINRESKSVSKGIARHVCAHCNASTGKVWINTYFGGCIDYLSLYNESHARKVYNKPEMRGLVESFVVDLEQYCAIVTDRLNNL